MQTAEKDVLHMFKIIIIIIKGIRPRVERQRSVLLGPGVAFVPAQERT
jgi:hypothetical protein